MIVLVLNCGSSSLKYRLIQMPAERELAGGEARGVGPPTASVPCIVHRSNGKRTMREVKMPDHAEAFQQVMKLLLENEDHRPDMLGHRIVHGGSLFTDPVVVDGKALKKLEKTAGLAPLHNPPAIELIRACRKFYPELPQVAVFDTAFHATIPACAYTYALPLKQAARLGIRKYGFHGTSHQYVTGETSRFLGIAPERFNGVSCHLGSGGASLCAVVNGKSMDNTMGYSPLQGLVMSTRCGDLDPAVVLKLLHHTHGSTIELEKILNKRSGVLGLSGDSAEIRDVFASVLNSSDPQRRKSLTAEVYLWRLRKYLGAYLTLVGKADAVIFTDSIGENVPLVRWAVCADMESFGLKMDLEKNEKPGSLPADIAAESSMVRILVVSTNEELAIAQQTAATLSANGGRK